MWLFGVIDSQYNIINKSEENFTEDEKRNIEIELLNKINSNILNAINGAKINISVIEQIGIACPGTVRNGTIEKSRKSKSIQFSNCRKIERKVAYADYIKK